MVRLHCLLSAARLACCALAGLLSLQTATQAAPQKVLRYAFLIAETGFDPAQVSDVYSVTIASNIFESPLTYDFLARPAKLRPQTAVSMPTASPDFKTYIFRIRPGIYFADDPVFRGQRRELTAADYVYSLKRHYDPQFKSPQLFQLETVKILGLSELRKKAIESRQPFPYDTPVEGLTAPDRYTLVVKVAEPAPRLALLFANSTLAGAVAREVIEAYAGKTMEHPVGTGPYRLVQWRRSSLIVLERNPNFREQYYDAEPPAGDAQSQAIAVRLRGRRLPMIDRVEVSIIEESQPRWLGFLNREQDLIDRLPYEFAPIVVPRGKLVPNLARQGVQIDRVVFSDLSYSYFGMEDPIVGGYTPERVALRRAISLAYDMQREVDVVRKGQAIPAQGLVGPATTNYDPAFKSDMSRMDLASAQALLDMYGYLDRDGDGWRDRPDGSPLVIEYHSTPDQQSRQLQELWHKAFTSIGIRVRILIAKWPEQNKASRAGKLMMWGASWNSSTPDSSYFLDLGYGPNRGQSNHARFDLPAYNALYERQKALPDGPERQAAVREMQRLIVAYMPYKGHVHRIQTDLMHPWVIGYRRHLFMREFWRYLDIDVERLPSAGH